MNRSFPVLVFRITLGLLFLLLAVSLFRLQVLKGEYYGRIAESNFVRIRRVVATRGDIYDSKYRPIVLNIPSHNLYLTSGRIGNTEKLAVFLKTHFGIEPEELRELVFEQRFKTYEEILLADNIPYETILTLSERMGDFPELTFRSGTTRHYLYPNHFTGYVGRINEEEYNLYREEDYSLNAYIGKTGLEHYYEVLLRGRDGKEIMQVDAQGRSLELFSENTSIPPQNGLSLILSIDNDLQEYANSVFPPGIKGCVIVADVETGGILAYLSKPDYDPNIFMQKISTEVWAGLNSPAKPLLDRIINASYPPGSVFKTVTGSKGLEAGVINRHTRLASCTGGLKIGNRFFRCWNAGGHGSLNIVDAHKVSCDVFFYDLIQKLDLDAVASHAKACGVVEKTGIDLPGERSGFYPDRKYYQDKLGLTSGLNGYKANLAIGQGEVLTTPLQMNTHYAAIARGGMIIQPHLLVQTMGSGRITREQLQPLAKHQLPWSASTMQTIRDGLWAVTNAPGGTARAINVPGATSYGKTGSAQNFMGKVTHAWFCGFIETDKPDIVITVFMENAGGGGAMAAPVANKIFNYYIGNLDKIRQPAPIPAQFRTSEERLEEPPEPVEDPVPALEAEAGATAEPPQQEAGEGAR
ncbi:MAG: penicillin-binding protein 2 [Candidatus Cloacimonetes bacterium]|nr:penicillin-binding protein 2 [Candidatus Cloacimonadota bacterium]